MSWRHALRAVGALILVLAVLTTLGAAKDPAPPATGVTIKLYSEGVAAGPDDTLWLIPAGAPLRYLPDSRVIDPTSLRSAMRAGFDLDTLTRIGGPTRDPRILLDATKAYELAAQWREWLAQGTIPGAGTEYESMARNALLDLHAMTRATGGVYAGPSRGWRYIWPRDTSFAAVAYARAGHVDDAKLALDFLQRAQSEDGTFEARYDRDGTGSPDDRPPQNDGLGWVLWAVEEVGLAVPADERRELLTNLRPMVDKSTERILELTADGTELPPPSADYWEVAPTGVTLGAVAPLLAGLESAGRTYAFLAEEGNAEAAAKAKRCEAAATRLRAVIVREFAPTAYTRDIGGEMHDGAVTFVQPPFLSRALPGAPSPWQGSLGMVQPAGGLAPGTAWRKDGVSWTPQTALFALSAAATGDRRNAEAWLNWIDEHRTTTGSIPEKVLADGAPAATAPLTWTGALVLLTVGMLDDGSGG